MQIAPNLSLRMYPELKEKDKRGWAPIYVKITVTGSKAKEFSSGIKNDPNLWNAEAWKFEGKSPETHYGNGFLAKIKPEILKRYLLLESEYEFITSELVFKHTRAF
jgi:hypothetical protein